MRKSIMARAKKVCRKVDYFTNAHERKMLAHPNYKPNSSFGVQKPFLYFYFLCRWEHWTVQFAFKWFTLGNDESGWKTSIYFFFCSCQISVYSILMPGNTLIIDMYLSYAYVLAFNLRLYVVLKSCLFVVFINCAYMFCLFVVLTCCA